MKVILICPFEKLKLHVSPSVLSNFQYFSTPSTLCEGDFHQWKVFEVDIEWVSQPKTWMTSFKPSRDYVYEQKH